MTNPMDLTGKHIVVTGASSGIGAETARHITRLGGKVSLIARRENKLQEVVESLEEHRGKYFPLDLSNLEEIAEIVDQIFYSQGIFDGCVYVAGIGDSMPLKMSKPARLQKVATINYLSYVEFVRCITMKKYRAASMSVVGISSASSHHGSKGLTIYGSTKAAINGAMFSMAHELAKYNIRVNNVVPGWVDTGLIDFQKESGYLNRVLETAQYIGQLLEPIDVANAVCFLLSDAARFITGTELLVNGGI